MYKLNGQISMQRSEHMSEFYFICICTYPLL